jgi:hypothetical protein
MRYKNRRFFLNLCFFFFTGLIRLKTTNLKRRKKVEFLLRDLPVKLFDISFDLAGSNLHIKGAQA